MDSPSARLLAGLAAVLFAGAVGALFWHAAVRPPAPPEAVSIDGLPAEAQIDWTDDAAVISTEHREAALTALGYVHGSRQPWLAELRRRTALGGLSEWFGGGVLPIDRHARQLGFANQSRQAYDRLPASTQNALKAYVRGLNRALLSEKGRAADEFVTLDVAPERWEPWHPLAVERLVAWLSTPSARWRKPEVAAPAPLETFLQRDRLLRRWLHVHGLERSTAWVARDTTQPGRRATLFQRHSTGTSALPFFQEVVWERGNGRQATLATVAGTLIFPAGSTSPPPTDSAQAPAASEGRSWAVLLGSPGSLRRRAVDTTDIRDRLERITLRGGAETLAPVRRTAAGLPFPSAPDTSRLARLDTTAVDSLLLRRLRTTANPHRLIHRLLASDSLTADSLLRPPSPIDSTWVVQWAGLEPTSDAGTWLHLAGLAGASPPPDSLRFALFDGVGLHVRPSGWTVTGEPAVQHPLPGGLFLGRTRWSALQADALRERLASGRSVHPASWSASDSSAWAARLLPRMVEAIGPLADGPPALRDAVTYLRNWNGVYDRASIGATLFDRWMRAYRSEIGRLPAVGDTAFFAAHRQRRALGEAVDSLLHEQGRDLRQWRWERVVPDRRPFPAFSADSLLDQNVESLSRTRYAPVERPGRGHPSTLADGPTLIVNRPLGPSPSTWEAWTDSTGTGLTVRRLQFEPSTFLARPLLDENRPDPVSLRRAEPTATTRLLPSAATETP